MRKEFADKLYELMQKEKDVYFVTGDLGYGIFDKICQDFPERFINTGAAEQTMMGVSIGLALSGKKIFVYSITPFLIFRPFEAIRTYINHEKIPVILVGSGRGNDYEHDGFSHYAGDDELFLQHFENIKRFTTFADLETLIEQAPCYLNLKR
jgi:transketolase